MCGIISYFGNREGILKVLIAADRLSYRAPDSTGIGVPSASGIILKRALGKPPQLIEKIINQPVHAEKLLLNLQSEEEIKRMRRQLAQLENLQTDFIDLSIDAGITIDNLFGFNRYDEEVLPKVSIKPGSRGSIFSRRSFALDENLQILKKIKKEYGFSSDLIKIILKEAFKEHLRQKYDQNSQSYNFFIQALEINFPFCLKGDFAKIDKDSWNKLWGELKEVKFIIPPDFDLDAVRFAFRILGSNALLPFSVNPQDKEELEKVFQEKVKYSSCSHRTFQEVYLLEETLNMTGWAFASLVEWFQKKNIPANHFSKIKLGEIDSFTLSFLTDIVNGHGRWGMCGAITEENIHPHSDHKLTRILQLNGSLDMNTYARLRKEQSESGYRHRSENDTEVIIYEVEKIFDSSPAIKEEEALRHALSKMKDNSEIAIDMFSLYSPHIKYAASHNRPLAIVIKGEEVMISSDINAALALWPQDLVEEAVEEIQRLRLQEQKDKVDLSREIQELEKKFEAQAIFLEGEEKFAKIYKDLETDYPQVKIEITDFAGNIIPFKPEKIYINPAQAGKGHYRMFIEYHLHEIPAILQKDAKDYIQGGKVALDSVWYGQEIIKNGLNVEFLKDRFGENLENLKRIFLVGVGSSERDAKSAIRVYEELLPACSVYIYDPVIILNENVQINPQTDLVIAISWSGTTASTVKLANYLEGHKVMMITVTGKIQSDLGRKTRFSGGAIDVQSGIEVSVCTVKGFASILYILDLLAVQLSEMKKENVHRQLFLEELEKIPAILEDNIASSSRRKFIHEIAEKFKDYTKVAVISSQPIKDEGELKEEEVIWIISKAFDFDDESLWPTLSPTKTTSLEDKHKVMCIVDATDSRRLLDALRTIERLHSLGVEAVVQTYHHKYLNEILKYTPWVYVTTKVRDSLQDLIDAPFFFELAYEQALAHGLTYDQCDNPRNLAKSVTVTGAEAITKLIGSVSTVIYKNEEFIKDNPLPFIDYKEWYQLHAQDFSTQWEDQLAQLPIIASEMIGRNLAPGEEIINKVLEIRFGEKLKGLKRIIIIADHEESFYAANSLRNFMQNILSYEVLIKRSKEKFNLNVNEDLVVGLGHSAKDYGISRILGRIHNQGGAIFIICDHQAWIFSLGKNNIGSMEIPEIMYENVKFFIYTWALFIFSLLTAQKQGKDISFYKEQILRVLPLVFSIYADQFVIASPDEKSERSNLVSEGEIASVVQNFGLPRNDISRVANSFKNYDKVHVIGGGEAFWSACEWTRLLRLQGVFAEAQRNDSAWHGPLAAVDPALDKTSFDYDATRDVLIIILATSDKYFTSALLDAQVYNTRRARILLVVQDGDQKYPAVNSIGAEEIVVVPKVTDELSIFVDSLVGGLFAVQFSKARGLSREQIDYVRNLEFTKIDTRGIIFDTLREFEVWPSMMDGELGKLSGIQHIFDTKASILYEYDKNTDHLSVIEGSKKGELFDKSSKYDQKIRLLPGLKRRAIRTKQVIFDRAQDGALCVVCPITDDEGEVNRILLLKGLYKENLPSEEKVSLLLLKDKFEVVLDIVYRFGKDRNFVEEYFKKSSWEYLFITPATRIANDVLKEG